MAGRKHLALAVALAGAIAAASTAFAAGNVRLAPINAADAVSTHGPFEMGACEACHDEKDHSRAPGRVLKATNDLCFDCHDEFRKPVKHHPAAKGACVGCHSPHNSKKKKLLL
jgi:predicted CXXCH cytochrome family protein